MVRSSLQSLGRNIDLDASGGLNTTYPFYAIPVPAFLELNEWVPHQDLVAQGKVIEIVDATKQEVLFCSHQWVSFEHPDPASEQLHALQLVIKKLMAGKTDVTSNAMLEAVYQFGMKTEGAEWAARLPHMYLWIDYLSIPQPGALVSAASETLVHELDANGDGIVSTAELVDAQLSTTTQHGSATSDHRLMAVNETSADAQIACLVAQLKAAVDSIPSYIERSSMMWVVVPPVAHRSVQGAVCDFASWRKRGWCRMEFAACKLACGEDMPLMVIKSAIDAPEFYNPCDVFKLCPARGDFSVASDRDKVNATLVTMLEAKATYYETKCADLTLARLLKAFAPVFVPRDAYGSAAAAEGASAADGVAASAAPAETAVARLQRFMGWRGDEVEAAWEATTGWNLLTLACSMDDETAVDELLARAPSEVRLLLDAKGAKMVVAGNAKREPRHRREPLGQKLTVYAEGMTPLMAAMTFSRASIVRKLLDAGADVARDGLLLLGEKPCTFRGAVLTGRAENVALLLARHPEYTNAVSPSGACPLHFAGMTSACLGQRAVMKALLEAGARPDTSTHIFVGSPLMVCASTYDQDPAALELLLRAGADPTRPEPMHKTAKTYHQISATLRHLGSTQMKGLHRLTSALPMRFLQTPAHVAAQRGDIAMVGALAAHSRFHEPTLRDSKGRTPLALAERAAAPCKAVPELMKQAIDASMPTSTSTHATAPPTAPRQPRSMLLGCFHSRPVPPTQPTKPRHRPPPAARGKAKYQVAPEAPVASADASTVRLVAGAVEEFVVRNASPAIQRPTAVQAARSL